MSLNKRKVLLIITEILFEPASTINSSTLAILNPNADTILSSGTDLLISIAILITSDYISKLKLR